MTNYFYTIGSNGKTAQTFFELLKSNQIDILLDVRLNNTSQLAGITKGGSGNLDYLLKEICGIKYIHDIKLAPSKEMLDDYKKNKTLNWNDYTRMFLDIYNSRNLDDHILKNYLILNKRICLLCSEEKHTECHRGIIIDQLSKKNNITVKHL